MQKVAQGQGFRVQSFWFRIWSAKHGYFRIFARTVCGLLRIFSSDRLHADRYRRESFSLTSSESFYSPTQTLNPNTRALGQALARYRAVAGYRAIWAFVRVLIM